MAAKSPNLWAPIVTTTRGTGWVVWTCISTTRRGAKVEYLRNVDPQRQKERLERTRFARVTITEDTK